MRLLGGIFSIVVAGAAPIHAQSREEAAARPAADGRRLAEDEAKAVVASFWSSRDELHSGVCHVDWSFSTGDADYTAQCDLHFDYDRGLARVDRTTGGGRTVQRIDTPKELIVHVARSSVVSRHAPFSPTVADGEPLDPRMVGLMELGEYQLSARLSQVRDYLETLQTVEVVELLDAPGKFRVTQESANKLEAEGQQFVNTYRRLTWIDANQRFSPIRAEAWVGVGPKRGDHMELQCRTEATWELRADAAVPLRCTFVKEINPRTAEMVFSWDSVNEPVSDDVFTADALISGRPSFIVNHRLGPKIIERKIQAEPSSAAPPAPRARWLWWVAAGAAQLVVVLIVIWLARRRIGPAR